MQLKRRHMNVLRKLAETPWSGVHYSKIPDGNGIPGRASNATMSDLRTEGLVTTVSGSGSFSITDAGLNAIKAIEEN